MRKHYNLPDKYIEIIETVKKEQGFTFENDALKYILDEYNNGDLFVKRFREMLKLPEIKNYLTRLRLATNTADRNSTALIDGMNTLLHLNQVHNTGEMYEDNPNPVLKHSEERLKEKIARNKQIKDNR